MRLDKYQESAIKGIISSKSRITAIYGSAGRGKTTLVDISIKELIRKGLDPSRIYFAGFTGKSALVLDKMLDKSLPNRPQTIHRLLGCRGNQWLYNEEEQLDCDFLFIEESSLLESKLLARVLFSVVPTAKIILSGDYRQLFPVGPGAPFNDIIRYGPTGSSFGLQVNYRQKQGSAIADACEAILGGKRIEYPGKPSDLTLIEEDDKEEIVKQVVETCRPWFDQRKDWACLVPQRPGKVGLNKLNEVMQQELNPPVAGKGEYSVYDFILREGDRVRCTKNSYALDIYNGMVGTVTSAGEAGIVVDFDGQRVVMNESSDIKNLVLGYALTIHSVQGSEFKFGCAVIDKSHTYMFNQSMIYVAFSRFKEELVVIGQRKTVSMAVNRDTKDSRNTLIKETLNDSHEDITG